MLDSHEYLQFVLGYDLLRGLFDEYEMPCDVAFETSDKIISLFEESEEYKDCSRALYTCLEDWLIINSSTIIKIVKGDSK